MGLIDLKSNLTWPSANHPGNPPAVDFFDVNRSVATGFTTNMYPIGGAKQNSQFLAVSNPDLLTSQYNNPILNLQGEQTPNSYIKQPFILRGIQRPGAKAKPQRWGFGVTVDDGFMRGGIVTATERSLVDVLRLGKWMLTPKGLLWNVKQLGLGFANPNVETLPGVKIPPTRLHLGPSTLLSVAGNAFGQHFTSHGLPLVSSLGNYGNVQRAKQIISPSGQSSRLVQLKNDLLSNPKSVFVNQIIDSSLGGANSVYGIGRTDIRRYINSNEGLQGSIVETFFKKGLFSKTSDFGFANQTQTPVYQYNINNQYFSIGSKSTYKTAASVTDDRKDETPQTVSNLVDDNNKPVIPNTDIVIDDTNTKDITSLSKPVDLDPVIGKYATLAYGKLKRADDQGAPNNKIPKDFRKSIPGYKNKKWITPTGYDIPDYDQKNIENVYRIGQEDEYAESTKDFINFYFTPRPMGGSPSETPIQFRAFLDSVSDSFSPTWNAEFDQGRADARILYGAFARTIGLTFRIAVFKREQIDIVYKKMEALARLTMPVYGGPSFTGTFCDITVGNLYRNVPVYIDSLTYDWDSESPWELTDGQQVPWYVSVSVNCTWIGKKRPDQKQSVFSVGSKT